MYKNFLRVASANIKNKLLNVEENKNEIIKYMQFAGNNNIDLLIFPELTLTGITGGDLLASREIVNRCMNSLIEILNSTKEINTLTYLGLPIIIKKNFFNSIFTIKNGKIINITLKKNLTNREKNIFSSEKITFNEFKINKDIICNINLNNTNTIISEDYLYDASIKIIFENDFINYNFSDKDENDIYIIPGSLETDIYKLNNIKNKLKEFSSSKNSAIIYAGASNYESSSNGVYSSQKFIFERDELLEEGKNFSNGMIYTEIDLNNIKSIKTTNLHDEHSEIILKEKEIILKRKINKYPYLPSKENWNSTMKNVLEIQSEALARRLRQIPDKKIFIGISGGLDSTLSLIVSSLAYHKLGLNPKNIYAITLPGLGTSSRTKKNATNLAKIYNTTFKEISIKDSILQHFKDIEHDLETLDAAYENAQARERTQVLMDLANSYGGIVLGTGNMSEIALGWATYNGDHMAMYSVNAGLPKTFLRETVRYVADTTNNQLLKETLYDIIDTPISPELLPTDKNDNISQKTEENIGPYELHDFFLYQLIRNKNTISNTQFLAELAFTDKYTKSTISKWYKKFLIRFVSQQFKRNVAVDAPMILDYSLNPKYGFVMPSDIDINALLKDIKEY